MFSDAGPDVRWVGNESGWAGETNWCMQKRDEFYPGHAPNLMDLTEGQIDGTHWVPAEVDVSIRPGWYYHQSEDHKVKSVKTLVDIYYNSIGRNASFLLNFPVDTRGLIHEKDVEQLMKMVEVIRKDLETNLAKNITVEADEVRGNSSKFDALKAIDGNPETYWATDDNVTSGSLILDFGKPMTFNRFLAQEYIPLGQRVKSFSIEAWNDGAWQIIETQTTIGNKRILRFDNVSSSKLRLNILDARACPAISNIEVYHAPKLLEAPMIKRSKSGMVTLAALDTELEMFYTTDGTAPTPSALKYVEPFELTSKGKINAIAADPATNKISEVGSRTFDICKAKWTIISPDPDKDPKVDFMIDENEQTIWRSDRATDMPQSIIVDLGESLNISGFTYLPTQQRYIDGTVSHYQFFVSKDGRNWGKPVSSGEFSNIRNNPILQTKNFTPVTGRFIKFVGEKEIDGKNFITIADLGILSE
jgi:alpha-L-fucosidase